MVCSSPVKSRRIKKTAPPQYTWTRAVPRGHHELSFGKQLRTAQNPCLCHNFGLPCWQHSQLLLRSCCFSACTKFERQSLADLTSQSWAVFYDYTTCHLSVLSWCVNRAPMFFSAHHRDHSPGGLGNLFLWSATFVSGRASTVARSFGHSVVSLLPRGFCHAHFSNYTFTCANHCVPFSVSFLFVSMKTGRDTSCRYTPMYIGLLCCLALGDMSAFVILDNSVLKKDLPKWNTFVQVTCLLMTHAALSLHSFGQSYSDESVMLALCIAAAIRNAHFVKCPLWYLLQMCGFASTLSGARPGLRIQYGVFSAWLWKNFALCLEFCCFLTCHFFSSLLERT